MTLQRQNAMLRRLLIGGVLLLCGVNASCSDATAPGGTLLVVVPDTVHVSQTGVPTYITYTERAVSIGQTKVWLTTPELEMEVKAGQWNRWGSSSDPNNLYLQAAIDGPFTAATPELLSSPRTFYLPFQAGRFRLSQRYQLTAQSATQGSGEIFVATSNPFVVVIP